MDDSLQQVIAVSIIVLAVALELWRRYRKKRTGKAGCDGCETGAAKKSSKEIPLKFYPPK